ncbi:MAG TPA: HAD family phosphatase [Mycobacteriales bacterium]|jgi:putative hydrolase of the HAD superfamily|nr:HAD family phosphatase [Mycobacteriales bacterium]
MTDWIAFDYGRVLTHPQPAEDLAALADLAGLSGTEFVPSYWKERAGYDRGDLDAAAYWSGVLGQPVATELREELDALDTRSHQHLNTDTFDLVERLSRDGASLALLSNTPEPLAAGMESAAWAGLFARHFYSCRLRLVKPEPAIYRHVLAELEAAPEELTFIDDRPENIEAARELGIRGLLFTDVETLTAELGR